MKIGLAYDLKADVTLNGSQPEDALEEYDSLETLNGITEALESLGHSVIPLGGGRGFLAEILKNKVDFVFNIAEGRGTCRSREAQVPAVLEMLDIPYSGADPQSLSICLDKPLTKKLVMMAGVATPRWQVISCLPELEEINWTDFPFPAFIKPAYEGSSKGIRLASRIESTEQINNVARRLLEHYQQPVMVEEYIAGDEITVGMVGNCPPEIKGIMRVLPRQNIPHFIYSLEVKRQWESMVDYECPAKLAPGVLKRIADSSLKSYDMLDCRDFARVDFRVGADGTPYFLEINPLAGLNPHSSDLPIMAGKMGLSYHALISCILSAALERYPQCIKK